MKNIPLRSLPLINWQQQQQASSKNYCDLLFIQKKSVKVPENTSFWYQSDHKDLVLPSINSDHPVSVNPCQTEQKKSVKKSPKIAKNAKNARSGAPRKLKKSAKKSPIAKNAHSRAPRKLKERKVLLHLKLKTPITFEPVEGFSISQGLRSAYCKVYRPVLSKH